MTDAAKATVWSARFKPFGETVTLSGTKALNLRFPGQYFQIETNFAYNHHRHYDPTTGRYTQPDPLGFIDGPSVYAYAGNSPWMDTDREGLYIAQLSKSAENASKKGCADPDKAQEKLVSPAVTAREFWEFNFNPCGNIGGIQFICGGGGGGGSGGGVTPKWSFGTGKSINKWSNQMTNRGWTPQQIDDAIINGKAFSAPNNLNPGNGATRYVNPQSGQSVVIDNVTREVIHIGGPGFGY
jgi:RHS repeat-associated protein